MASESSEQKRKNRYLTRLSQWLASNPAVEDILNTDQPELQRDYQLINFLLATGKFHLEITHNEICMALIEAQSGSLKSSKQSDLFTSQADQHLLHDNFSQAFDNLSKAILNRPLNDKNDYKHLATLFFRRMKCSLEMKETKRAALDAAFVRMADEEMARELFAELDGTVGGEDRLPESVVACSLAGCVELVTAKGKKGGERYPRVYSLRASQELAKDTSILTEKPFVKYSADLLKCCAGCGRRLESSLCWPCEFCTTVGFCNRQCYEQHFEFHKYECGITGYISQIPLMLIMLRFYVRCEQTPLSRCPKSTDYIRLYLDAIQQGKPPVGYVLNAFRQLMDNHEDRHELVKNREEYFVVMILAIEFLYLFDACHYNAHCMAYKRSYKWEMFERTHPGQLQSPPVPFESFSWAKDFESKQEMIAYMFRDMKRFITSPFVKFSLKPEDLKVDRKRDRQLLILSNIVFPKQVERDRNVLACYNKEFGFLEIRTTDQVEPLNPLIIGRKLLKV